MFYYFIHVYMWTNISCTEIMRMKKDSMSDDRHETVTKMPVEGESATFLSYIFVATFGIN